ncbi:MAG: hypothetical protein R3C01_12125 [Planctomycetaceae bacterium]
MSSSLKNIRVAVIDDHPIVWEALMTSFFRNGFQLDSLSHQTEAGLRAWRLMSGT